MTLIKTMVPALIQDAIGQDRLPYWLQRNEIGGIVYSTLFAFFIILPLSTARQMGSLKYMSALGLIGSIVLMIVIIYEFATNSLVVPDISVKLKSAQLLIVSWSNTIETIPFIIFLYMYQALLPQYYKELNRRSISRMDKVVKRASTAMILVYVPMGIFGYLTFADNLGQTLLSEKTSGNILECDYKGSRSIQFARLFVIVAILASTPFCFIPAKDTYFSLIRKNQKSIKTPTDRQNLTISAILVLITYLLSVAIPNIKDAIAITGATVNPFIGFIFPIVFYLKLDPLPMNSRDKIFAVIMLIVMFISCIMSMYVYIFQHL
ncbi:hypothetical protein FGO68_gene1283 [Halteria grandinella]|uniref:Amino acid transporter transmembrane domain-containing protein n=1 Tax=Halteria grandinella TaxID=5974 RepID=A0A8J8T7R1_HALGN|nr:hypothetical protein FGO68_gene1283 [Halteria grandinella]